MSIVEQAAPGLIAPHGREPKHLPLRVVQYTDALAIG